MLHRHGLVCLYLVVPNGKFFICISYAKSFLPNCGKNTFPVIVGIKLELELVEQDRLLELLFRVVPIAKKQQKMRNHDSAGCVDNVTSTNMSPTSLSLIRGACLIGYAVFVHYSKFRGCLLLRTSLCTASTG